jgi:nickel-dependent lactate racemase
LVEFELPDHALIYNIAEATHEPPAIDNVAATEAALDQPLGSAPIEDLVGPGSKVALVFPDRVKGGSHDAAHRKVALPQILARLERAGVSTDDISPICAIGLHRKNSAEQMHEYLPQGVIDLFGDRIVNHDAEDPDGIVHYGFTDHGDQVDFNKTCANADLVIMLGHVQGNPYGGFSGGHKTFTTGLTTWRSIAAHHVPATMHRDDFVPISTNSHFRRQLHDIGQVINSNLKQPIFICDAAIGKGSNVLGVWAGDVDAVEAASWPIARLRTDVTLDIEPADVLVFGLPRDFHYGPGMGTNPILMSQAIAAVISRVAGAFRRGGVAIVSSLCNGWFNEEWFPSYPATYERWKERGSIEALLQDVEEFATNQEWVDDYRFRGAYHPFHAFSMLSMGAMAHSYTSQVILVDPERPDIAEEAGYAVAENMDQALQMARSTVGMTPSILATPDFLAGVPPHLFANG